MNSIHKDVVIPLEMGQVVIASKHLEEMIRDLTVQMEEN